MNATTELHNAIQSSIGGPRPGRAPLAVPEKLLLAAPEAATLIGVSVRRFHELRPELPPAVSLGLRCVRWRRGDLERWIAGLPAIESARGEPPQLTLGKAKRRASGELAAGLEATTPENEAGRGLGRNEFPSNLRRTGVPEG